MISVFPSTAYTTEELAGVGYPILDKWCTSAKLYAKQNGEQYIKLIIPHRAEGVDISLLPKELQIIKIHDMNGNEDYYRVRKPQINLKYTTIYAEHITYDLNNNLIEDIYIVNSDGQQAMDKISKGTQYEHPFDLRSDIQSIRNLRLVRVNPIQAILGNSDNTFINRYGGELKRQGFTLSMNKRVGVDRTDTIRSGKNLTGFESEYDFDDVVTRIMPKGPNGVLLPEKYIDSPLINHYPFPFIKVMEYKVEYEGDFEKLPQSEKERVYNELRELAKADFKASIDIPKATYKVNFVTLRNTVEYEYYEALENIGLGDLQPVYESLYDILVKGRVVEIIWDILNKKYDSITLGNFKDGIVQSTLASNSSIKEVVSDVSETALRALKSADEKTTNYYGNTAPSNPKEGDLWYKKNGQEDEMWQYQSIDGKLQWVYVTGTLRTTELKNRIDEQFENLNASLLVERQEQDRQIADVLAKTNANTNLANAAKQLAERAQADLVQTRTDLTGLIGQVNAKATQLEHSLGTVRTDVMSQAQSILAQARAQADLTSRVNTVESTANGTKATVTELSKTLNRATGDISSVSSRTKTVEDSLSQTRTQYEALTQTVNIHTGQIDAVNRRTGTIEVGLAGVTERFESLQIGGENLLLNASFEGAIDRPETFAVGGVVYRNKDIPKWNNLYNGNIANPTTSYHALYRDNFDGKGPVIEFNESDGSRNWKAISQIVQSSELKHGNYTFSADMYATGPGTKIWFGFYYYNKEGRRDFHSGQTYIYVTSTNKWNRLSGNIKLNDDIDFTKQIIFYIYAFNFTSNSILYLTKPKLEEGTIATAFSLAQESLRSEIAIYKQTADETSEELRRQIQTLDGKAIDAKNYAQHTAEGLKTRIESLETYKNTEDIRASQYFTASRDETARQVSALRTAVTSEYVAKAKYEEDARGITQRFESLQVSGRNLLASKYLTNIATSERFVLKGWASTFIDSASFKNIFKTGETYTLSFDAKIIGKSIVSNTYSRQIGFFLYSQSTNRNVNLYINNLSNLNSSGRFKLTFTCPEIADDHCILFYTNRYAEGTSIDYDTVEFSNANLIQGNIVGNSWIMPQEDQQSYADTKIAEYSNTVDGRFATIQSQVSVKANQVDLQTVRETVDLYERIIGSTEAGIKDKVARMVMSDSLFLNEVKDKISGTATQVSQLSNSYAIKNLTSAGTILGQLNLNADGSVRLNDSLISIGDKTYIKNGIIKSAMIGHGQIGTAHIGTIDAAVANIINLNVNRIVGLDAEYIKAKIEYAMIDWMKGKTITGTDNGMTINLNQSDISFHTARASVKRQKNGVTGYLNFQDDRYGGVYAALGVTSNAVGIVSEGGVNYGKFAGVEVYRPNDSVDKIRVVGDRIELTHGSNTTAFIFRPSNMERGADVDMNNIVNAVRALAMCIHHLGANNYTFTDGVKAEINRLRSFMTGIGETFL